MIADSEGQDKIMLEDNCFPVDIYAVKLYGVDKWRKSFFWPVDDVEFVGLCSDIENLLNNHLSEFSKDVCDAWRVKGVFMVEYWNFLHARMVKMRIEKRGMKPVSFARPHWYSDTCTDRLSQVSVALRGNGFQRKLYSFNFYKIKKFIWMLLFNIPRIKFFLSESKHKIWIYGIPLHLARENITKMPGRICFIYPQDFSHIKRTIHISKNLEAEIKLSTEKILILLLSIAKRYGIVLSEEDIIYLRTFTYTHLLDGGRLLLTASQIVEQLKVDNFMSASLCDSIQRALAIAVKSSGGRVISFTHGGAVGLFKFSVFSMPEFEFSDKFVTYTKKSAELWERVKHNSNFLRVNKTEIVSGDSVSYHKFLQKFCARPLPKKIKIVMLIGIPHYPVRKPTGPGMHSLIYLDLELRLIEFLSNAGYEVLYKAHPDRLSEIEGIFEKRATVISDDFKDTWHMADTFIFSSITTTAFSYALCTNRPICAIMTQSISRKPFKDALAVLEKRCYLVDGRFDERNRIMFDTQTLLEALAKKPEQPNTEFVETYLFS